MKAIVEIANRRKLKEVLHVSNIQEVERSNATKILCLSLFWNSHSWKPIFVNEEGGPQSLARLLEDTLYRATQNNTDMDRSGELVLPLSNPDFEILASCWYNYTQNYKKNTMQAKRHHDGKGINAKISLHNAPRVGVQKFVIYIHWSSANVNFIGDDCAANANTCAVDSKDAKSIVPGDIAAVQKPIKTCKQRSGILLDHDWEQGRLTL